MNKMLKIGVLCIVFLLCDCQVQAQKIMPFNMNVQKS